MPTIDIRKLLKDPSLFKEEAFINNQWVKSSSGASFPINNPATGEIIAQVANLGAADAEKAIAAADQALPKWKAITGKERAGLMRKWFDLILQNKDDLAILMTLEQGKPLAESAGEVVYGASFIEWYAEEAKRVSGTIPTTIWGDKRFMVLKQPVGVCVAITPWNFPNAMITRKIAPAMAAGCTIVIKPAEQTPLSALALAELAVRAGIPEGVVNIITADADQSIAVGKTLCASPTVRHLSFTGSTEVGRILMAQCAPTVKKLGLELGGHAPFIVFDDADIDAAVAGAIASKYRNSGQTCVCANRLYVHKKIHDVFVEKFAKAVQAIKVGNGMEAGISQGPLIDQAALEKVERHIADALSKGAKLVTGGKPSSLGGTYYEPTILDNVTNDMLITYEETFGPVAPIITFESDEEVVQLANNSQYGLASYFYSRDIGRIWKVAEALEYGMVGVNSGIIANEVVPFGGVKQSGLGREGSVFGMDEYLELKYVCITL
ncbi:NAD-dependent succinate-semialdehyde dehydrogenase [Polynucleobacter sp. AP-Latsch-80-C2]|jgi:succinate-semialdehyde dehydrogenase/glutarate-semialdehyde dehydrogenase|uniref:NAD-dependent succinate-semialdehyde dehydrogenase n=1 Tax=Polynucleobacter sp. AP-Latsch-80-C2 TaxID=2576931 RepID=UPI001C0B9EEC|nr:NAD-dependent succinate-semialdehyde dehydrogenase [Polynucleobacter sp. AP-Latsch-80-C2]MBU3623253.1 NAD-dependent succinate-semialdehyde dehydrogenase [Polynucleobacter sp. AP-Latsch-80-C2]